MSIYKIILLLYCYYCMLETITATSSSSSSCEYPQKQVNDDRNHILKNKNRHDLDRDTKRWRPEPLKQKYPSKSESQQQQQQQQQHSTKKDSSIAITNTNINREHDTVKNAIYPSTEVITGMSSLDKGNSQYPPNNNGNKNNETGGASGIGGVDVCPGDIIQLSTSPNKCVGTKLSSFGPPTYIGNKQNECSFFEIHNDNFSPYAIRYSGNVVLYAYLPENDDSDSNTNENICFYPRNNLLYRPNIMPVSKVISLNNGCSWTIIETANTGVLNNKVQYGDTLQLQSARLGDINNCIVEDSYRICKGNAACKRDSGGNGACQWITNPQKDMQKFSPQDTLFTIIPVIRPYPCR